MCRRWNPRRRPPRRRRPRPRSGCRRSCIDGGRDRHGERVRTFLGARGCRRAARGSVRRSSRSADDRDPIGNAVGGVASPFAAIAMLSSAPNLSVMLLIVCLPAFSTVIGNVDDSPAEIAKLSMTRRGRTADPDVADVPRRRRTAVAGTAITVAAVTLPRPRLHQLRCCFLFTVSSVSPIPLRRGADVAWQLMAASVTLWTGTKVLPSVGRMSHHGVRRPDQCQGRRGYVVWPLRTTRNVSPRRHARIRRAP